VSHNLPWFLKAAEAVQKRSPQAKFVVASFKPHQAEMARRMIADHAQASGCKLDIEVHVGRTPEVIHAATCCMAVSGSVSLELLYHVKPTVILYWISKTGYFVQSFFRRVKYITLVNLLSTDELFPKDMTPYDPATDTSGKVLFPEYLTYDDKSQQIAGHVVEWLLNEQARERVVERLAELRSRVAAGGASAAAAQYIVAELEQRKNRTIRPHFIPHGVERVAAADGNSTRPRHGAAA
jgi:lipid-A-disaccharide synthase